MTKVTTRVALTTAATLLTTLCLTSAATAQDRLKSMPGYEQYTRMAPQIRSALGAPQGFGGRGGGGGATWAADGKSFEFENAGKRFRFDVDTKKVSESLASAAQQGGGRGGRGGGGGQPERGRQFDFAVAPSGNHRAIYKDRNVWVGDSTGAGAVQITTDGSVQARIKYGTASWVYGEELAQRTAMWWSPDGTKLAYYRFDESKVPDFYLTPSLTKVQDTLDIEAYPKPGVPNPVVDLFVYDVNTKKNDARRRARRQAVRERRHWLLRLSRVVVARRSRVDVQPRPTADRTRSISPAAIRPPASVTRSSTKTWPTGWIENSPLMRYLADSKRFIWESERNGFKNYYLYDLTGALIATLTNNQFEAASVVRVDEAGNALYYTARDGDNYMKLQLHRVGLDGKNDKRLTDPAFTHTVSLSPDGKYFVDVAETHDQAPVTRLVDANGKVVQELAKTDLTKFNELGLKKVEMYTYLAADGKTQLHGMIHFPSTFDPTKKYPVLVTVYGGPASASNTSSERFQTAERADRVRLHRAQSRFARHAGHGQEAARRHLSQARPDRDGRHGRGREGALGTRRTSTRTASASTARRTAATRRRWRSCDIPRCSRPRRRRRRRRTGATTTRSTPSGTCGFRRRTRKATTRVRR